MPQLEIHQFPCLSDNYGVLIHDGAANVTASIDAPDAAAVRKALALKGWTLTHILTTHHHADHTDGNRPLKEATGCQIVGPGKDADRIPGIDVKVVEGDEVAFGGFKARVIETPGHTSGHISYWFPDAKVAFVGDTVFSLGCGRLFEGDGKLMWDSLSKVIALPPETMLYCGHEYTQSNARFALTVEPGNKALQQRAREVDTLRAAGKPTLPTKLGDEMAANPFLRPDSSEIQERLGMKGEALWKVFAEIRKRKDNA
ncbi:MAG: hydroxyacylglutathione hydrolase [Pseudomonadota bacterium]|nr:hydroxyacylglutathione hydrolase [Pseudomonadota bacterium]